MNKFFAKMWVAIIKAMAHISMPMRERLAQVLAFLLWIAIAKRRHVTLTNLRLCFPEKSEKERILLAKNVYRRFARAAIDHGLLWEGTAQELQQFVKFEGLEHLLNEDNRPIIVVAPHFAGLDAAGIALNTYVRGVSLYQKQSNEVWDAAALAGRMRFSDPVLIAKSAHNDLRPVIREMRKGLPFYYLPDMDHGIKNSIFVPFFGVPAATLPMVSRLAGVLRAKVLFCVSEMTTDGYLVHISEVWDKFPSGDVEADTRRISAELERWILKFPDQYLWSHRRFKTRPMGEPSVY